MDLIFNERSLEPLLDHITEGRALMASMVETLATGLNRRTVKALRTDSAFGLRKLARDYTVLEWMADGTVDREAKRLITSQATKAPYVDALMSDLQGDRLAEFTYQGAIALGCGVAVLRDEPVLSARRAEWGHDPLVLEAMYLEETGTEQVREEVVNIFSPECFERRSSWFLERGKLAIRSGNDVIADADGLFQHLRFCSKAMDSLQKLRGTEVEFVFIVRHLAALDQRARSWQSGLFVEGYPFAASPESPSTLAMYGEQRRFLCPDGRVRQFSWHSKITLGANRIYFLAEKPGEPVLIGYIGRHLDIVTG